MVGGEFVFPERLRRFAAAAPLSTFPSGDSPKDQGHIPSRPCPSPPIITLMRHNVEYRTFVARLDHARIYPRPSPTGFRGSGGRGVVIDYSSPPVACSTRSVVVERGCYP